MPVIRRPPVSQIGQLSSDKHPQAAAGGFCSQRDRAPLRALGAAELNTARYSRICSRSPSAAVHSVWQEHLSLMELRLSSAAAVAAMGKGHRLSFVHDGQITGTLIVGSSMALSSRQQREGPLQNAMGPLH
jgi:hypothetical protein